MKLCPRGVNKFVWRCHKAVCDKTISIYAGTPFAFAKIHLSKVVMLMFYFANEEPATKVRDYVKLSDKTITQWYDICRGYCSKEMIRIDMKVGGPGHVVEIDETSLAKKQKYHRGKKYVEFWVFGGYDRSTRNTHIISDLFASYVSANTKHTLANEKSLKHLSYMHTWVNHSKDFKDPVTGAHTNGIEGCWEAKLKSKIKKMRGLKSMEQAAAIVDECLWRSWFFHPQALAEQKFKGLEHPHRSRLKATFFTG
ncbi:hypothetical protein P43SY_004314 [Pythium insidiosum]|uniref:ISXO2-like transposase domain-containing protein n=1 Tax=Pythium insidiosum TaxID=114742 RepID=A0AAD5LKI9_PYTIN|nr:hypothetical protein P43SY_004314 [Pythium insidiosum]